MKNRKIILASNSPRRRELLGGLFSYEVRLVPDIDESYPESLLGEEIPLYISRNKAAAYTDLLDDETVVITADTIVWLDGAVLGKPVDVADAKAMLRLLSGRTHEVITGVTLRSQSVDHSFACTTLVRFAVLTDDEIAYYVERFKPFDKAGSYGVQEWIGYIGVEYIEGSYFNVMGLPIQKLYRTMRELDLLPNMESV